MGVIEMLVKITLILCVISFVLYVLGRIYVKGLNRIDKLRFASKKFTKGENIFLCINAIANILAFIMIIITAIYIILTYL